MEVDALLFHDGTEEVEVAALDRLSYGVEPPGQQGEPFAEVGAGSHAAVTLERGDGFRLRGHDRNQVAKLPILGGCQRPSVHILFVGPAGKFDVPAQHGARR